MTHLFLNLLSCFVFSISVNLDSLAVGFSYGNSNIIIKAYHHFLIATITALLTFLSIIVGSSLSNIVSSTLTNILGSIILILLGLWLLRDYWIKKKDSSPNSNLSHKADMPTITLKECTFLAIALTLNNCGLGIGAGITGMEPLITTVFTLIISTIFFVSGYHFGRKFSSCNKLSCTCSLISAILIVAIGVFELFI
ncbi:MAG: manganese efflux pump [Cellulosilyticaceae bacterium]